MNKLFCLAAVAMISTLSACGGADQADTNLAVDETNAVTNLEALPPVEAVENEVVEPAAVETPATPPAAEKTETPAMPKPKPAPAKPTAPAPAPAPDPHAGHDMNNM